MSNLMNEAALEWLRKNTKLEFTNYDDLTAGAKLFVEKYNQVMSLRAGVASESIEGLSQSFTGNSTALLWEYARQLIGADMLNSSLRFFAAERRWR